MRFRDCREVRRASGAARAVAPDGQRSFSLEGSRQNSEIRRRLGEGKRERERKKERSYAMQAAENLRSSLVRVEALRPR
jgi:hypothetical protein